MQPRQLISPLRRVLSETLRAGTDRLLSLEPFDCLHPDARYALRRVRLGRIAAGLPGGACTQDEVAVLACGQADAVAGNRPYVFGVAWQRRLVDACPAVVIEGEQRKVTIHDLETGHDVPAFDRRNRSGVAGRLAHRVGAHAVRSAEREFLGGGQVLDGALAG